MKITNKPLVLVTGGAGQIGTPLRESLSDEYNVVSLDVQHDRSDAIADSIYCDFTDSQSVGKATAQVRERYGPKIAAVVHLADHFDATGEPNSLDRDLTIGGTNRLLSHLCHFDVEQLVYASCSCCRHQRMDILSLNIPRLTATGRTPNQSEVPSLSWSATGKALTV
jgi:nucleoside-diphosphate-sugar epimerase